MLYIVCETFCQVKRGKGWYTTDATTASKKTWEKWVVTLTSRVTFRSFQVRGKFVKLFVTLDDTQRYKMFHVSSIICHVVFSSSLQILLKLFNQILNCYSVAVPKSRDTLIVVTFNLMLSIHTNEFLTWCFSLKKSFKRSFFSFVLKPYALKVCDFNSHWKYTSGLFLSSQNFRARWWLVD